LEVFAKLALRIWEVKGNPGRVAFAIIVSVGLAGCGLSSEQRRATITFGRSLDDHGQLLADESVYLRAEVKALRVLAISLPNQQSESLFHREVYKDITSGVPEPRIQRLVEIGGAASKFGGSLAQVAEVTSSTADEQILTAAIRQFSLTAGAIAEAAGGSSIGMPAVNLITFISAEAYRRRYIKQALPAAEPAFRIAEGDMDAAFNPRIRESLLSVFTAATDQLAALLSASPIGPNEAPLSAGDRNIIANSYRLVASDRDHIKYVTSRELDLMNKGSAAYQALMAAFRGDQSQLSAVESYSIAVSEVRLAFKSLK
jgi:hypothetical protein